MMTPNQISASRGGCPRIFSATGASSGMTMKAISKKSMNMPSTNTSRFTTIRKPSAPPGSLSNRCSTHFWPSAALKVKENTVEPIRMNSTKQDSRVVLSSACLSRSMESLRRASAMMKAPSAPMAPPSVGVARPRKIVPSTRKIRISGGISTKVTRSESFDSRCILVKWLSRARPSAVNEATVIDMMTISSPGAAFSRPVHDLMMPSWNCDQTMPAVAARIIRTSSDLWPLAPLASL